MKTGAGERRASLSRTAQGVQHSSLAGPGQRPAVEWWFALAAQALVVMQVPATPPALQDGAEAGGGAEPPPMEL